MQKTFLIIAISACLLSACNNSKPEAKANTETLPKVLSESESNIEIDSYSFSKRGSYDLVGELYEDLLKKDPNLQQLEKNIADLQTERGKVSKPFLDFNKKNQSYYESANSEINAIKDSLLKQRMLAIIAQHQEKYHERTLHFQNLIEKTAINENTIADYHSVLKIALTLPLIEKYQKNNMPDDNGVKTFLEKQNKQIQGLQKMTKF